MTGVASPRLSRRFYERAPDIVARALLGKMLVNQGVAGMIVETEAYLGPEDKASHARFGQTQRTEVMFGLGGIAYVYLCYGIHHLFNVVAGKCGSPGAVLIRALALTPHQLRTPASGVRKKSGGRIVAGADWNVANGPGKLTRALGIDRSDNGCDLCTSDQLYIGHGKQRRLGIAVGPRVGIDYAGDWVHAPLRFWIDDHPAVSGMGAAGKRSRG